MIAWLPSSKSFRAELTVVMLRSTGTAEVEPIGSVAIGVPLVALSPPRSLSGKTTSPGAGHWPVWIWAGWGVPSWALAGPLVIRDQRLYAPRAGLVVSPGKRDSPDHICRSYPQGPAFRLVFRANRDIG